MVVCVVALFAFSVMSIFSAKYRPLAKKAFICVFRKMTLRPCDVGLDKQIKAGVVSRLMKRNERIAGMVYRNFSIFSFVFTLIFFASMAYSVFGLYNLAVYGSCEPHSQECVFTDAVSCGGTECQVECLCEDVPCEAPLFEACEGNCDCQKEICG